MLIKNTRGLKNGVFRTTIEFVSYGSRNADGEIDLESANKEQEMIENYGAPEIAVGGLFELPKDETPDVEEGVEPLGDEERSEEDSSFLKDMFFILPENSILLDESFTTTLNVDSSTIEEVNGVSKETIAEMRCLLFESIISDRINEALDKIKDNSNDFEKKSFGEVSFPTNPFLDGEVNIFKNIIKKESL